MTRPLNPKPWERQKGESRQAFQAFAIYRDMGPARSLQKVAQQLSKSLALMKRWSEKWSWVARAQAWDDEQDRIAREAQQKEIEEMNRRHAQEAMALQRKAVEALKALAPEDLRPRDVLAFFVDAAKLERLARGMSTEHVEHGGELEVKQEHEYKYNIIHEILADPEALALANALAERMAAQSSGFRREDQ